MKIHLTKAKVITFLKVRKTQLALRKRKIWKTKEFVVDVI